MSDHVELNGQVTEVARDKFKVIVDGGNHVLAQISGKMRLNKIRILLGDKVLVKVSPYDTSRGIIVSRL